MPVSRRFDCPAKQEDGSRRHAKPKIAWLKVMPGPEALPRTWRPWCERCLAQAASTDSVIVATTIHDFWPGSSFPLTLAAVEQWRRKRRAQQGIPDEVPDPADSGREAELGFLSGCYSGRGHVTPRAWARMVGLRPLPSDGSTSQ
jgi:hypothetical protein